MVGGRPLSSLVVDQKVQILPCGYGSLHWVVYNMIVCFPCGEGRDKRKGEGKPLFFYNLIPEVTLLPSDVGQTD